MVTTVLITGITGFVGSHMADWILTNQPHVELHATRRYHLSKMDNVRHIEDKIVWHDCNVTDPHIDTETDSSHPTRLDISLCVGEFHLSFLGSSTSLYDRELHWDVEYFRGNPKFWQDLDQDAHSWIGRRVR